MKLTNFLKLKKPDYTDAVDIKDINDNMDSIDLTLKNHFDDTMPHLIFDKKANKKYKYGYQTSSTGKPQIVYEEVIE